MEDYYNYAIYEDPTFGEVWYPLYFRFEGPGPSQPTLKEIILGVTYAIWSAGALAGPPHHLKVVSDMTTIECSSKYRRLRVQVVDRDGRNAGTVPVRERFYQGGVEVSSVPNGCRNNEPIYPTRCAPTDTGTNGRFTDHLTVGCPLVGGNCGIPELTARWSWCPNRRPEVQLMMYPYSVSRDRILINGVEQFSSGTHLY